MEKLRAFHGERGIKDLYLARVMIHREMDELHQGVGWEKNGKTRGCAVGCTLDVYDHALYPVELGVPVELARLEDRLFELMPRANAMEWPARFLEAIPVGADLSKVWGRWAVWMLVDPDHGVIKYAGDRSDVSAAIERVAQLWRDGGTREQFAQARTAAYAARAYAARASADAADAAADAAAAAAAAAYAYGAAAYAYGAAAAADAAAYAAAADVARGKWAIAAAEKLLELLAAA